MRKNYHHNLCGIDEAGRGPFAGPMTVAGVVLKNDIQETKNVAEQFPEIVKKAKEIMEKEHRSSVLPGFQFSILGE